MKNKKAIYNLKVFEKIVSVLEKEQYTYNEAEKLLRSILFDMRCIRDEVEYPDHCIYIPENKIKDVSNEIVDYKYLKSRNSYKKAKKIVKSVLKDIRTGKLKLS